MLTTTKVTAVPVDDQPDLTLETAGEEELTRDAEKMCDVLKEVNVTYDVLPIQIWVPVSQFVPAAPKAKAKPASKQKLVFAEPEVQVTSSLDEVQAEVVLPFE